MSFNHRFWVSIPLLMIVAAGCRSTPRSITSNSSFKLAEEVEFWEPHLLYTSSHRYKKLYVEVDVVESAAPKEEVLEALAKFLEQHCDKPGGITIHRDDLIPGHIARDRDPTSLSLEYIDGPPDDESAFMHLLYYNSKLTKGRKEKPFAYLLPFPGSVLIDHAYGPPKIGKLKQLDESFVLHEVGHLLGLTRNKAHSEDLHCTNDLCVNNAKIYIRMGGFLSFNDVVEQKGLCADCQHDLAAYKKKVPADNLSFLGPYIVRDEGKYQVLSLPAFVYVHIGPAAEISTRDLERDRRKTISEASNRSTAFYITGERDAVHETLPLLKKDPYRVIREIDTTKIDFQADAR